MDPAPQIEEDNEENIEMDVLPCWLCEFIDQSDAQTEQGIVYDLELLYKNNRSILCDVDLGNLLYITWQNLIQTFHKNPIDELRKMNKEAFVEHVRHHVLDPTYFAVRSLRRIELLQNYLFSISIDKTQKRMPEKDAMKLFISLTQLGLRCLGDNSIKNNIAPRSTVNVNFSKRICYGKTLPSAPAQSNAPPENFDIDESGDQIHETD
jgi:hypothetical protein